MPESANTETARNKELAITYNQLDKTFYTIRIIDQFEIADELIEAQVEEARPCRYVPDIYTSDSYQPRKCLVLARRICSLCTITEQCLEWAKAETESNSGIYVGLSSAERNPPSTRRRRGVATGAKVV